MITVDQTVRTYYGRSGCGCRGTYHDSGQARKLALNYLLSRTDTVLQSWTPNGSDVGCLYTDTQTGRVRVLYLSEEGVESAKAMGF